MTELRKTLSPVPGNASGEIRIICDCDCGIVRCALWRLVDGARREYIWSNGGNGGG